MNIVVVPFHDWRKIQLEGFRTRDAHFIEELNKNKKILKVIINRPTTILEIVLKKKLGLIQGKVIYARDNFKLYEIEEGSYLIDFVSYDILGQIFKGYRWFIQKYGEPRYIKFINNAFQKLGIQNQYFLLNQNIFAYQISENLNPEISLFDAWDNFAKFGVYFHLKDEIVKYYEYFAKRCDFWITNSKDNRRTFKNTYKPQKIHLISNGVDVVRFAKESDKEEMPEDLKSIPKPIVGFGGKITQLIDVGLLNETMKLAENVSFVFVGQILDKNVFKSIEKGNNFHYLGDKHYDDYPNYVKNFDVCIVPYVVEEERKSGANTIKGYEYLATNKKVVGTNSNGLEDLIEHLYIIHSAEEFAHEIMNKENNRVKINSDSHSWQTKTNELLTLLQQTL
ncbi:glycosyltransferase [Ulvibacterium marinum]|uniref:Glycosyltransferase n=1 Tax=Ulvibacterium marinum TaxID=2419782 RepID=A0A3B0CDU8_9FLAO|nr:glycosyltransferase [Ulvibacterium marinum]RKN82764.1 glycosyltransferase [Ulvibacterium marinum]